MPRATLRLRHRAVRELVSLIQGMETKVQKEMDELHRDKSYQDALKTIPDVKKESDPWRDAR